MKKLLFLFTFLGISSGIFAQVSKTVNLPATGTLSSTLTATEQSTVTNLTLTGTIDARDFKTIRDNMPLLAVLDISGVTIVAYNGTGGTKLNSDNYPAAAIPENAFFTPDTRQSKTSLISVVLPSSVSTIGNSAFEFCTGLTSVTLPSSLISIGNFAFNGCSGLTTITIPSSITSIGKAAFQRCSGLTSVAIPSSVTYIDQYVFNGCSGLTSVTIPSSVTSIGTSAFENCSGLTSITIPSSVKYIGTYAFFYCSGLTSVAIPSSVTSIREATFARCSGLTTVSIPSSVTSIGEDAFSNCRGLTTVMIPSSVTSIGNEAFYNCSGLTSITTSSLTPLDLSLHINVFQNVDKTICTLYVPVGSKSAYQSANQWKDFTNIVEKDFTGIDPIIRDQQLTVYPNPTSGKVKLVFDQISLGGITLVVHDFTGKTILTQLIKENEAWIDLGGNSPGAYFINTNLKNYKVQKAILK